MPKKIRTIDVPLPSGQGDIASSKPKEKLEDFFPADTADKPKEYDPIPNPVERLEMKEGYAEAQATKWRERAEETAERNRITTAIPEMGPNPFYGMYARGIMVDELANAASEIKAGMMGEPTTKAELIGDGLSDAQRALQLAYTASLSGNIITPRPTDADLEDRLQVIHAELRRREHNKTEMQQASFEGDARRKRERINDQIHRIRGASGALSTATDKVIQLAQDLANYRPPELGANHPEAHKARVIAEVEVEFAAKAEERKRQGLPNNAAVRMQEVEARLSRDGAYQNANIMLISASVLEGQKRADLSEWEKRRSLQQDILRSEVAILNALAGGLTPGYHS
jgi:hypothetical protein